MTVTLELRREQALALLVAAVAGRPRPTGSDPALEAAITLLNEAISKEKVS